MLKTVSPTEQDDQQTAAIKKRLKVNLGQYMRDKNLQADKGERKQTFKDHIKEYFWMLWDGLDFFGFDDTKLARLNGKKTSYLDKFKNKKWVGMTLISLIIIVLVFARETRKLG